MNRKMRLLILLLLLGTGYTLCASGENEKVDEKARLAQIETYYQAGKDDMQKGSYPSAIMNFNHVIVLERDFNVFYTPYAQGYIKKAKEKIKENEEKQLTQLDQPAAQSEEVKVSSAPSTTVTAGSNPATKPRETNEYVIGKDDVLFISVWQNRDLDQEVTVRLDGNIGLLLIGEVKAEGLTVSQLVQTVTDKMKSYIKYPEVSVTIRKIGGKKIIILGEVKSPGVYTVSGKSTVLELIGLANGYTNDAVLSSVLVIRGGLQNPVGKKLDLARAMKKADMSQNIVLEPEDIVYVPKNFISNMNYVMTQILNPIAQGLYTTQTIRHW